MQIDLNQLPEPVPVSSFDNIEKIGIYVFEEDKYEPVTTQLVDQYLEQDDAVLGTNYYRIGTKEYLLARNPEEAKESANRDLGDKVYLLLFDSKLHQEMVDKKLSKVDNQLSADYDKPINDKSITALAYRAFRDEIPEAKEIMEKLDPTLDNYAELSQLNIQTKAFKDYLNNMLSHL